MRSRYQRATRPAGRTLGILLRLAFLCAGAAFMTFRVSAQKTADAPPAQSSQTAPRDDAVTIKDDPTIAPDPNQSADNNVSFPIDI